MAIMIPDSCPSNATVGEKRVFGLLMLEVKGWYAGKIARTGDDEVELHRTEEGETRVERHEHPASQFRE